VIIVAVCEEMQKNLRSRSYFARTLQREPAKGVQAFHQMYASFMGSG